MKALWVSHYPVFGGPHNLAARLREPLSERGIQTAALLPEEWGSAHDRLQASGIELLTMPLSRIRRTQDPRVHWQTARSTKNSIDGIRDLLEKQGFDAVIVGGLANPHAALAAARGGQGVVWQLFDTVMPKPLVVAGMPLVRRYADSVMFNGNALREHHLGGRELKQPSFEFAGAVDSRAFVPSQEVGQRTRARCGVPQDAPFIGTVANRNPQKGIEWFIRGMGLVFKQLPDAYFLISGAAYETHREYEQMLAREREKSGIPEDRWVITDERPEEWYPALDVKCITSVPASEGMTTTAFEALSCEIPVVATRVGAVDEVVIDGETGLVVEPNNPQELSEAVLKLMGDPELRREFGSNGRKLVKAGFDLDACADVHAAAIHAAIDFRAKRHTGRGRGLVGAR